MTEGICQDDEDMACHISPFIICMSKIKRQFHKTTHGTSIPHTVYDTTFASLVMHAAAMIANDALSGAPQSLKPTVKPKPTVTTVAVPIAKDVNPKTVNPTVQPIKKQRKRKSQTSAKALK